MKWFEFDKVIVGLMIFGMVMMFVGVSATTYIDFTDEEVIYRNCIWEGKINERKN